MAHSERKTSTDECVTSAVRRFALFSWTFGGDPLCLIAMVGLVYGDVAFIEGGSMKAMLW